MATKRTKNHGGTDEEEQDTEWEDRLSDLPDAILVYILSFIPTIIAVRMSLLSKRWRRMWRAVPVLDFLDSREIDYFRRHHAENYERKRFFRFMDECLWRPRDDTAVTKFKLGMDFYGAARKVDAWLRFPVREKVEELDLKVVAKRYVHYCLPDAILGMRTLTLMKLEGVELNTLASITLPNLRALHLKDIQMADAVLSNLLASSPQLERLHVKYCSGLLFPGFVSSSLKVLEFGNAATFCNNRTTRIVVRAKNLESFLYDGDCCGGKCLIDLEPCPTLRNLSLTRAHLLDKWLEVIIPMLPSLESLNLTSCHGLQYVKISNRNLKSLVLRRDSHAPEPQRSTTILAPNLVSFRYIDCSLTKLSLAAPCLLDSSIRILMEYDQKVNYDTEWYTDLIQFLSQLNCSKNVQISCHEKALIIPKELRELHSCPMPDLKNLTVEIFQPLFRKAMFRKSINWVSPSLESLTVKQ